MKYKPSYDQIMALDLGLNGQAGMLLDLIIDASSWATMTVTVEGKRYYHLAQSKIMEELPAEFGSPQSVTRCIKKLHDVLQLVKQDSKNYYRVPMSISKYWGRDNKNDEYKNLIFQLCGNNNPWQETREKRSISSNSENGSANSENGSANSENGSANSENGSANSENGSANSENGSANSENGSANSENGSNNITNKPTNKKTNNSSAAGVFADLLKQHGLWVDMNRPDHRALLNSWVTAKVEPAWLAMLVATKILENKQKGSSVKSVMFFKPVVAAELAKKGKPVGGAGGDIRLVPPVSDHAGLKRWATDYQADPAWELNASSYEDWRTLLVAHRVRCLDNLEKAA